MRSARSSNGDGPRRLRGAAALDLPLTVRGVDGVYYRGDYDEAAPVDLAGSRDTLVDVE